MTLTRQVIADRGDAGKRVDLVLRRHLGDEPAATRTRVQRWIADGAVTVNDRPVTRVSRRVAAGDLIVVAMIGARQRAVMTAEPVPIDVLFEDEHLLVVNKPAGIVTHPTYGHLRGTLMNALLWHARRWRRDERPSVVGRLDKDTSGLVVVSRTRAAHAALQRALNGPDAKKEYLAVVHGIVKRRAGTITLPLARDPRDRRRVVSTPDGLVSETRFVRLSTSAETGAATSLLACRLMTGRMHQIRVHLSASGWPIVGDVKYGPRITLLSFPRQALHAWRLTATHPITRVQLEVESPIPDDMARLLRETGLQTGP